MTHRHVLIGVFIAICVLVNNSVIWEYWIGGVFGGGVYGGGGVLVVVCLVVVCMGVVCW